MKKIFDRLTLLTMVVVFYGVVGYLVPQWMQPLIGISKNSGWQFFTAPIIVSGSLVCVGAGVIVLLIAVREFFVLTVISNSCDTLTDRFLMLALALGAGIVLNLCMMLAVFALVVLLVVFFVCVANGAHKCLVPYTVPPPKPDEW